MSDFPFVWKKGEPPHDREVVMLPPAVNGLWPSHVSERGCEVEAAKVIGP